jgi:glycosidase
MPTVNLDVPVVINNVEQPEKGKYSNDQALSYMQQRLRKLLPVQVKKISSLKIDKSRLDTISRLVDDEFEKFKQNDSIPIRITYIADRLVSGIIGEIEKYDSPHQKTEEDAIKRLGSELRNQLYTEFSKYLREQPRLDITANTADLKNAGTKDILAYLRFTITEEAFEWDVVEEDKNIKRRLLPE